jgi:hypothetical protein
MERNMLSWNIANWITVLIMAAAGYAVLAVVSQVVMKQGATQTAGTGAF